MKFAELPTTDREGKALEPVVNGVVRSVSIDNENHGALCAWLHLEFGHGGCGFGGYKLGNADGGNLDKTGGNYAAEWLVRCINTVLGTWGKWEDLAGKPVRVLSEGWGGTVVAVGHYMKDEWFCPRIEFDKERK